MKKSYIPFCLFLMLQLSACVLQKPIAPEYVDYIGEWQSDTYALEIFQNGSATYNSNKLQFARPRNLDGRVKIDGEKIRIIGTSEEEGGRVRLRIDEPPTIAFDSVSGQEYFYMILEGDELRRTD
ncbi:MAG: hypothetical protein R3B93_15180 [Bacteroidia bacterium]